MELLGASEKEQIATKNTLHRSLQVITHACIKSPLLMCLASMGPLEAVCIFQAMHASAFGDFDSLMGGCRGAMHCWQRRTVHQSSIGPHWTHYARSCEPWMPRLWDGPPAMLPQSNSRFQAPLL